MDKILSRLLTVRRLGSSRCWNPLAICVNFEGSTLSTQKKITYTLIFFSLLFWISLFFFFYLQGNPCNFLIVFPFFPRNFRGLEERKNPCFFGGFPSLFPKKARKRRLHILYLADVSDIFYFFYSVEGEGPGESEARGVGGGVRFFNENPQGGGGFQKGEGPGGKSAANWGILGWEGWGLNIFFWARNVYQV